MVENLCKKLMFYWIIEFRNNYNSHSLYFGGILSLIGLLHYKFLKSLIPEFVNSNNTLDYIIMTNKISAYYRKFYTVGSFENIMVLYNSRISFYIDAKMDRSPINMKIFYYSIQHCILSGNIVIRIKYSYEMPWPRNNNKRLCNIFIWI